MFSSNMSTAFISPITPALWSSCSLTVASKRRKRNWRLIRRTSGTCVSQMWRRTSFCTRRPQRTPGSAPARAGRGERPRTPPGSGAERSPGSHSCDVPRRRGSRRRGSAETRASETSSTAMRFVGSDVAGDCGDSGGASSKLDGAGSDRGADRVPHGATLGRSPGAGLDHLLGGLDGRSTTATPIGFRWLTRSIEFWNRNDS